MTDKPSEQPDAGGAVKDPAGYYNDPDAIRADKTLSAEQKRRFLDDWHADLAEAPDADPKLTRDVEDTRAAVARQAAARAGKSLPKR